MMCWLQPYTGSHLVVLLGYHLTSTTFLLSKFVQSGYVFAPVSRGLYADINFFTGIGFWGRRSHGSGGWAFTWWQGTFVVDQIILLTYSINIKVPCLDQYDETQKLHGTFILCIKEEHTCQQHLGENGSIGHCYVMSVGRHIGLNMRRLSMWAAACVSCIL